MGGGPGLLFRRRPTSVPTGDAGRLLFFNSHIRAVFGFLVAFYVLTVPLGLYLLSLLGQRAFLFGFALQVFVIVPLGVSEVRTQAAIARGERSFPP